MYILVMVLDRYVYTGYGIGFDLRSSFLVPGCSKGKSSIISGSDMRLSVHIDNSKKETLILGEGPTQGLDDTTLTAEVQYPINLTQSEKRFILNLHQNGGNSFLFSNGVKIYQLKYISRN